MVLLMKKILAILLLSLLGQNLVLANDLAIMTFNKWLYDNGHHQYLNIKEREICKKEKKYSQVWYGNGCDQFQGKNNLKLKLSKKKWTLPEEANPNFDTLLYYFFKYQHSHFVPGSRTKQWDTYEAKSTSQYYKFKSELKEDKYIKKQMNKTALLSYLLYEDGKITVDEISPKDRFGNLVNNETK